MDIYIYMYIYIYRERERERERESIQQEINFICKSFRLRLYQLHIYIYIYGKRQSNLAIKMFIRVLSLKTKYLRNL